MKDNKPLTEQDVCRKGDGSLCDGNFSFCEERFPRMRVASAVEGLKEELCEREMTFLLETIDKWFPVFAKKEDAR